MLDQVRERIYVVGIDYRYRYANERVIEFEGWSADEIVGRHVVQLVGPLIFKRLVKPRLDRCFRGENVAFQHWVRTKSGQRQYIDVLFAPFREWDGRITGAIVTIRDKTGQKGLEDELRDQVDLYRQLVENSVVGIAFLRDDKVVFANEAMAAMFGYDGLDDMLARNDVAGFVAGFVVVCDQERMSAFQLAHIDGEKGPAQVEFDGLCKDGRVINVLVSASVTFWNGKPALQLIAVDITRQKDAEHELATTAANFRDVVEGSLQGFFVLQSDRFAYVNRAFTDLLGYSVDELRSSPSDSFYAPHERRRMIDYRVTRLNGDVELEVCEAPETYEVDALHKDGRIVRLQQSARRTDSWFGKPAILVFALDVTDRHRAEQALEDERNLLRSMIDNVPAIVFAKDLQSRFLIKNKAGAAFVGETDTGALIGRSNTDYYPKDTVDTFRARELQVIASGEALIDDEHEVVCPGSGETVVMNGSIAPLRNGDDEIVGIVGVSRDVTRHRQSEAALRENERRFKDFAEVASDWFWEMDADLRFSYLSERASELAGTDIPATLGKRRSDVVMALDENWYRHADDLDNRRPFRDFRYLKRGDDSELFHVSISGVPIFDADGMFLGYRGVGTNINKEVAIQDALAKERNLLRAIIDNVPDAIFAKDLQARYTLSNFFDSAEMGESSPDQVIGRTDFDYYPKAAAARFHEDDIQVMASGVPIIDKVERLERPSDRRSVWYSTSKLPLRSESGEIVGLVGISRDITEAQRLSERLHYQATHDSLTDLMNRAEFERRLERALAAVVLDGRSSVLCYIDIDQFKVVNDSAGHMAGDQLIRQIADVFRERIAGVNATLARLGGDEFGLLIDDCALERAEAIAQDLIDATAALRFAWGDHSFNPSASVGLAVIDRDLRDVSDALARADIACYAAKDAGRNRVRTYRSSDLETHRRHEELLRVASLQQAVENDRLFLMAQPIAPLLERTGLHGEGGGPARRYEILLRLEGKDGEVILPGAFIPAAERYGLMSTIDQWVVRQAIETLQHVLDVDRKVRFNVNLSGQSLTDRAFQKTLLEILSRNRMPPKSLCFEITETAVISHLGQAKRFIGDLRDLGCCIALDDFGCGLSSFSYLKQFPVDYIKIDASFIQNVASDDTDRAIVQAINHVGHVHGIETVAEGVENPRLLQSLRDLHIDYAQGYVVGRPAPLFDVVAGMSGAR